MFYSAMRLLGINAHGYSLLFFRDTRLPLAAVDADDKFKAGGAFRGIVFLESWPPAVRRHQARSALV